MMEQSLGYPHTPTLLHCAEGKGSLCSPSCTFFMGGLFPQLRGVMG